MDRTKFVVALAVVFAGTFLWYQRGLITRDHELCLDATQALNERLQGGVQFENEDAGDYIDAYMSWYQYCRSTRYVSRNPEMFESHNEQANQESGE